MKTLKSLFIHIFSMAAILMVTSCVKEETSYAFQDVSAPTDLAVAFEIAQDDSGNVTVTPAASGATSFMIYFGDTENETPVVVAPGESADHTYAEGVYTMKVVAEGMTGLTSELNKEVTISFSKPEDLVLDIETVNLTAKVTPTATNAAAFDIYFGAAEGEEPVTVMDGETASFTYAEEGAYTVRVVARGAGTETTETTVILNVSITTAETLELPLDFESETLVYSWGGFGGVNPSIIANPDQGTGNESNFVLQLEKTAGAETWGGAAIGLDAPIDFSQGSEIAIKVWSPRAGTAVLLKLEDSSSPKDGNGNPSVFAEVIVNTTKANTWETLIFDMATSTNLTFDPTANNYDGLVLFADFGNTGQGELFFFDDILLPSLSDFPLSLPLTFDDPVLNYAMDVFNGVSFEVVDNPDLSGANTSASRVGKITNSGNNWEGGFFTLGEPVDFSVENKTIAMRFWSDVPVSILLKAEGGVNGERQTEVTAQHGGTGWEVLTFDFATDAIKSYIDGTQGAGEPFVPEGQYSILTMFVDGPGTTAGDFYIDDITHLAFAAEPLTLPVSFDDAFVNYNMGTFNGASFKVVDNPDQSGANAAATKVGNITNSGNNWEGGAFTLGAPADFSTGTKVIKIKVWSMAAIPVMVKFEGGVNGERQNEVVVTHGGTGWEELTFDFANNATKSYIDGSQGVGEPFVPEGQYSTMVIFMDGPGNTAGDFYIDDIVKQ